MALYIFSITMHFISNKAQTRFAFEAIKKHFLILGIGEMNIITSIWNELKYDYLEWSNEITMNPICSHFQEHFQEATFQCQIYFSYSYILIFFIFILILLDHNIFLIFDRLLKDLGYLLWIIVKVWNAKNMKYLCSVGNFESSTINSI